LKWLSTDFVRRQVLQTLDKRNQSNKLKTDVSKRKQKILAPKNKTSFKKNSLLRAHTNNNSELCQVPASRSLFFFTLVLSSLLIQVSLTRVDDFDDGALNRTNGHTAASLAAPSNDEIVAVSERARKLKKDTNADDDDDDDDNDNGNDNKKPQSTVAPASSSSSSTSTTSSNVVGASSPAEVARLAELQRRREQDEEDVHTHTSHAHISLLPLFFFLLKFSLQIRLGAHTTSTCLSCRRPASRSTRATATSSVWLHSWPQLV